jgi:hypothetical protein
MDEPASKILHAIAPGRKAHGSESIGSDHGDPTMKALTWGLSVELAPQNALPQRFDRVTNVRKRQSSVQNGSVALTA